MFVPCYTSLQILQAEQEQEEQRQQQEEEEEDDELEEEETEGAEPDPSRPEGVVQFVLPNFSQLTDTILSEPVLIRNLPW